MKNILMIATGGTIACKETPDGLVPGLSGDQLLEFVPDEKKLCKLETVDLFRVDSTNVTPSHWIEIARVIRENYERYDGFLVTHGTDTMSYTAAGLSYLIQGNDKPIAITGSQLPINNTCTDATLNLRDSLLYLVDDDSRDTTLVFGGVAIAGTRATKRRTFSLRAFESVNLPVVAEMLHGTVRRSVTALGKTEGDVRFYDKLDTRVGILKLVPGMDARVLKALMPYLDAVIIEGFGLGGIPSSPDWLDAVFEWLDSGRIIVATSQAFEEGFDMGVYEVGHAYVQRGGMLMAGDMACEALVAKTMWALGQTRGFHEVEKLFYHPVNHDRIMR